MDETEKLGATPRWRRLEDFRIDQVLASPGRTITESDLMMFDALTGTLHVPVHNDKEWVRKNTAFRERIAPGPMTFSYAIGMLAATLAYSTVAIAFLGVDRLRAPEPVFAGDTIRAISTVAAARPTSDGKRGVVEFSIRVVNQDQLEVMSFQYTILVRADDGSES